MNIIQQIKQTMSRWNFSIKDKDKVLYKDYDIEITKREVIFSVIIASFILMLGFLISGKISEVSLDSETKMNQALQITDEKMFKYGINTNVGNALCYGELSAVDAVSYLELDGEYMYIKKVKEECTEHSRTVSNGKTSHVEYYYTWDEVSKEEIHSNNLSFLGEQFDYDKIDKPSSDFKVTIYSDGSIDNYYDDDGDWDDEGDIRYSYYVIDKSYNGTLETELKDNTISDDNRFYENKTIQEVIDDNKSSHIFGLIFFWFVWIIFIVFVVFIFYYLDNRWLD